MEIMQKQIHKLCLQLVIALLSPKTRTTTFNQDQALQALTLENWGRKLKRLLRPVGVVRLMIFCRSWELAWESRSKLWRRSRSKKAPKAMQFCSPLVKRKLKLLLAQKGALKRHKQSRLKAKRK